MSAREKNIDRFDAYLKNDLNGSEKALFEQELLEDETLSADFEAYKSEVVLIKTLGIREEMSQVMTNKSVRKKTGVTRWLLPLGVAAAIVLAVLFIPGQSVDHKKLFGENFKPYPNAVSGRDFQSDFTSAMNYYDRQQYTEAIDLFNKIPLSDTVAFYKSVSYLALEQPRLAIPGLRYVEAQSLFSQASDWYLGLSYLSLNQRDSARYYMEQIAHSDQYSEPAGKILNWIDQ